ncbi:MAG: hypothetical protein ABI629_08540, partial [bacterium]
KVRYCFIAAALVGIDVVLKILNGRSALQEFERTYGSGRKGDPAGERREWTGHLVHLRCEQVTGFAHFWFVSQSGARERSVQAVRQPATPPPDSPQRENRNPQS